MLSFLLRRGKHPQAQEARTHTRTHVGRWVGRQRKHGSRLFYERLYYLSVFHLGLFGWESSFPFPPPAHRGSVSAPPGSNRQVLERFTKGCFSGPPVNIRLCFAGFYFEMP